MKKKSKNERLKEKDPDQLRKRNKKARKKHKRKVQKMKIEDPKTYSQVKSLQNRHKRRYQRKKRMGNDPVRIFRRFRKLTIDLFYGKNRKQTKAMIKDRDIDCYVELYKGRIEKHEELAADCVDKFKE